MIPSFNPMKIFSMRVIVATTATIVIGLSTVIFYQKYQKSSLRESIVQLNSQVVGSEASYQMCLTQIDVLGEDHNRQLLKQVESSKLAKEQLRNRISEVVNQSLVESNAELNKTIKVVEKYDWSRQKPPIEILEAINEKF
ncbi:hypothetical protein GD1_73 [Paraglaciecola Antarctic GD virus 1]|nr:hypothetical protein GD1_73 [Paraglaciecola Antarctic GD virus 1]